MTAAPHFGYDLERSYQETRMVHPTDEQTQAVEAFQTARLLKIAAFAGTGNTSALISALRWR
jgi:hypothetical protein